MTDLGNNNPSIWGAPEFYLPEGEQSNPDDRSRGDVWGWIGQNSGTAFGVVNDVLCTVNPSRPGCAGDPVRNQPVVINQTPQWVYLLLVALFIFLLVLVFKR